MSGDIALSSKKFEQTLKKELIFFHYWKALFGLVSQLENHHLEDAKEGAQNRIFIKYNGRNIQILLRDSYDQARERFDLTPHKENVHDLVKFASKLHVFVNLESGSIKSSARPSETHASDLMEMSDTYKSILSPKKLDLEAYLSRSKTIDTPGSSKHALTIKEFKILSIMEKYGWLNKDTKEAVLADPSLQDDLIKVFKLESNTHPDFESLNEQEIVKSRFLTSLQNKTPSINEHLRSHRHTVTIKLKLMTALESALEQTDSKEMSKTLNAFRPIIASTDKLKELAIVYGCMNRLISRRSFFFRLLGRSFRATQSQADTYKIASIQRTKIISSFKEAKIAIADEKTILTASKKELSQHNIKRAVTLFHAAETGTLTREILFKSSGDSAAAAA